MTRSISSQSEKKTDDSGGGNDVTDMALADEENSQTLLYSKCELDVSNMCRTYVLFS